MNNLTSFFLLSINIEGPLSFVSLLFGSGRRFSKRCVVPIKFEILKSKVVDRQTDRFSSRQAGPRLARLAPSPPQNKKRFASRKCKLQCRFKDPREKENNTLPLTNHDDGHHLLFILSLSLHTCTTIEYNSTTMMKLLNSSSSILLLLLLSAAAVSLSTIQVTSAFVPPFVVPPSSRRTTRTEESSSSFHRGPLYNTPKGFEDASLTVAAAAQALQGKTVVVKYGGNAMTSEDLKEKFCEDVAALQKLGIRVVVVHGGGPQISSMLEQVGVETRFEGGMRVSSKEVVDVAEMVLCGSVNKEISSRICSKGGRAIGISGRDDSLLQCTKEMNKDGYDLGFVGKVERVNTDLLHQLLDVGLCPVVSPIGTGMGEEKDIAYNCNADVAAGRIAGELKAARVLFLTDIAGVLDKEMKLLESLTVQDCQDLMDDETITGGMIPKVSYATSAVQLGVGGAFITDGRVPHALLKEVLGGGASGLGSGGGGTAVTM